MLIFTLSDKYIYLLVHLYMLIIYRNKLLTYTNYDILLTSLHSLISI